LRIPDLAAVETGSEEDTLVNSTIITRAICFPPYWVPTNLKRLEVKTTRREPRSGLTPHWIVLIHTFEGEYVIIS